MTRIKLLLLLTISLLISCKTAEEYLNEAGKLEDAGKYSEAIALLDKAIEKNPKLLGAYINRGADKSALNDFIGAISDYEKVVEIDPKNTLALYNIAKNQKRLNKNMLALEFYNKALTTKGGPYLYFESTPNEFTTDYLYDVPLQQIFYERGLAYYDLDSLNQTYTDMQNSIKKNYNVKECHYMIGAVYVKSGQLDKACSEFNIAADLGDKDAKDAIIKYCSK